MYNKVKKQKHQIIEIIIIFIITLIFSLVFNILDNDEVWSYGFSYNITKGLIPYKDFNMIITPFYPFISSLFMKIFGTNIITYHIFNSLICTSIFYFMKKTNSKSYYISYGIFLLFCYPNYNILCLLFLYILIILESKKANDYLIGFILAITFLTKQSIGIYLCIPSIFIKDIKKIIKRIIGLTIPILIFLIYLLYNNILLEFIDYAVLGILDFASDNIAINMVYLLISIISVIYLTYKYIKTKNKIILYLILFQGMAYPLFDLYHVMISFIPVITYFLSNLKLNKKTILVAFIFFITSFFIYNIYQYNQNIYSYPNATNIFKYRKINNQVVRDLNNTIEIIKNTEGNIYIIDISAYLFKLELQYPINKFDLLNDGNLGYNGKVKLLIKLKENCKTEKCAFLLNENQINIQPYSKFRQELHSYIKNNYKESKRINELVIYTNYE